MCGLKRKRRTIPEVGVLGVTYGERSLMLNSTKMCQGRLDIFSFQSRLRVCFEMSSTMGITQHLWPERPTRGWEAKVSANTDSLLVRLT